MRSFAAVATILAVANAYAYVPVNVTSSAVESTPVYPVETPVYETTVVSEYTTVCPTPTEIVHGSKTYTVTESTTLTITDCPCTVSYPVHTPEPPKETPVAPAPYPTVNGTVPAPPAPVYPTGTAAPTSSKPEQPEFTGAASKAGAAVLAMAAGLAAFL